MYKLQNAFPFDIPNSHEKYAEYIYISFRNHLKREISCVANACVYRMSRSKVKIDVG